MNDIDEGYIRLAEAIVSDGVSEYVRAAKYLMKNGVLLNRSQPCSSEYYRGKRFILSGCNGLVGTDPKELLRSINAKFGIDADRIEKMILVGGEGETKNTDSNHAYGYSCYGSGTSGNGNDKP